MEGLFKLSTYNFELPQELIAQYPAQKRDESRLLVIHRKPFKLEHRLFRDVVDYFEPGDVLVLNKSKVIKARLFVHRKTGGKVELLVVHIRDERTFEALAKPGRKAKPDEVLFVGDHRLRVLERLEDGKRLVEIETDTNIWELLEGYGRPPLPPYIRREPLPEDEERYQTVFAEVPGSIAAPTAGLHFTVELLNRLKEKGVRICYVILHVGVGTFKPIRVEDIRQHKMDPEYFEIPDETAEAVLEAKSSGHRVTLCGTTVTRSMETWALGEGPQKGWTSLFIHPPFKFKVADRLITNFHLPKSTPLILTAAFAGLENVLRAYKEAIRRKYRFFSYGDATLVV